MKKTFLWIICLVACLGLIFLLLQRQEQKPVLDMDDDPSYRYVSLLGADTNEGLLRSPWRTLQHAVDQIQPGQTIWVLQGKYDGARIERSGLENAYKTINAVPGHLVEIIRPGPSNKHKSNLELETWEYQPVAYWVIEGFEVHGAPNWGIDVRGDENGHAHHIIIRNNKVHHNGVSSGKSGIFTAFTDDVLIEENVTFSNGEHGIYHSNSGDRPYIRNNESYDNAACGIQLNADSSMGGDGIVSEAIVASNYIHDNNKVGGAGINLDGVFGSIVFNNYIHSNGGWGVALYQDNGAICSQSNQIVNNTIHVGPRARWGFSIAQAGCINNSLVNNKITSDNSRRGSVVIPTPKLFGFDSEYNLMTPSFSTNSGQSTMGLMEWQDLGFDRTSPKRVENNQEQVGKIKGFLNDSAFWESEDQTFDELRMIGSSLIQD